VDAKAGPGDETVGAEANDEEADTGFVGAGAIWPGGAEVVEAVAVVVVVPDIGAESVGVIVEAGANGGMETCAAESLARICIDLEGESCSKCAPADW
jgi:hypothetical protein